MVPPCILGGSRTSSWAKSRLEIGSSVDCGSYIGSWLVIKVGRLMLPEGVNWGLTMEGTMMMINYE